MTLLTSLMDIITIALLAPCIMLLTDSTCLYFSMYYASHQPLLSAPLALLATMVGDFSLSCLRQLAIQIDFT